jgi:signal transduction histidine kinase/HPt (histidine-containing phosphotransfer) domain-containing protein/AmiR/NasT family two-component response regulator
MPRRRETLAGALTASILGAGAFVAVLGLVALRPGPDEAISIAGTWKSRLGDDPAWSRPELDDSAWSDVQVPMGWGKRGGPDAPFGWFRRTVALGPAAAGTPGGLALTLGKIDSAYEVFVGGVRIGGVGSPPPNPRVEYDRHRTYAVPPSAIDPAGSVVIAVRVWNSPETNARVPSLIEGPFLMGPMADLTRREMLSELPELILAAVFFVTGLYHLQLHRRRPELREYMLFGLVAVGAAAYTFLRTQWKYVLFDDFVALKEAEHALLFVMAPLYVAFLFPFLSWPIHPLLRVYQALNVAAAGASLASPGLWLNLRMLTVWEYATFIFTPYALSVVARAWVRGHPEGRTIGFGVLALSVCYLNDTALDLGWIVSRRVIPFGFAAFVFSMAISLANRFTRVHGEVEVLRRDLERRVLERTAELSHANLELQARTRQLAEASHAKSQFLANVSHEIRTPMNGIVGMARLLQETSLTAEQREHAEIIVSSARALLRIIEDILDSSKIEAGVFELDTDDFDLRRVVDDVVRLLAPEANGKGISLSATVDPAVPDAVRGDPGRLRQALVNLVGNAVKFTAQGAVTVLAEAISSTADAHVVRFEVRDTGIGISPAARERLFRPFSQGDSSTTRRFGGTGLGLAISRRLVEMMGGRIEVVSEEGAGSTFSFAVTLGRADAAAVARATADAASASSLPDLPLPRAPRRGRVLVAEDNDVNQKVTVRMLERLGFEAEVVGTGQAAASAVRVEKYDAILMDGQMPGMDGFEATAMIRAFEGPVRHTPIIALTAGAMRGDRERFLAAGMDDYLAKPISPEQLEAVLQRWVPASGRRPELPAHARSAAPPEGPIDWTMVSDLLALTPPDFLGDLLALFFRDVAAALTDLRIAWRDDDLASWSRVAHKLRGSCATLGARSMMALCAEMEDLDQAAMMQSGEAMLEALESEFARARELLADHQRKAVAPLGDRADQEVDL